MKTYGIKYIGSKNKLNPFIINLIREECKGVNTIIDAFTGTSRVAQALRYELNLPIITSDLSDASDAYAHTFVHNDNNSHLEPIIQELNLLDPEEDWLSNTYCDVKAKANPDKIVRVWRKKNGAKADAIRNYIETLTHLKHWEKMTLITSLIFALQKVDNTVGIQQAYLKNWEKNTYDRLVLKRPPILWHPLMRDTPPIGKHLIGDSLLLEYPDADIAYLDPPYTAHSYSTYYHIWDSIVKWDKPDVGLDTNRRIDRVGSTTHLSTWNSKQTTHDSFEKLIKRLPVRYVIISYNDEGLIPIEDIIEIGNDVAKVKVIKAINYKRNSMSNMGNLTEFKTRKKRNNEYLILIEK